MRKLACTIAVLVLSPFACSEVTEDPEGQPAPAPTCTPTASVEGVCDDGMDGDCDGLVDCADPDCATDATCEANADCGKASYPGDTLAIPDGVGMSYESAIEILGFGDGQTLDSADGFVSVCVEMEHSWLRDLQLELVCPSGQTLVLQAFMGRSGGEVYMGVPDDNDGFDPTPGIGMNYCWTADAPNPTMLEWADENAEFLVTLTLPEGDYATSAPIADLSGCTLNGDWIIRATDDWGQDNGYIFGWTLDFDPGLVPDCSSWPIE